MAALNTFVLSSLRWHYPDQVQGSRLRYSLLSARLRSSSPLCIFDLQVIILLIIEMVNQFPNYYGAKFNILC